MWSRLIDIDDHTGADDEATDPALYPPLARVNGMMTLAGRPGRSIADDLDWAQMVEEAWERSRTLLLICGHASREELRYPRHDVVRTQIRAISLENLCRRYWDVR